MSALLEIANLRVAFPGGAGPVHPVDGVSLTVHRGEMLAVVGESGCGKSLTAMAVLRLVPPPGRITPGSQLWFDGIDLGTLPDEAMRRIRGRRIGMVFQDPMTSLNPVLTVGYQLRETLRAHLPIPRHEAKERAVALLTEVGIPDPAARLNSYPHQLSGGLRQRVLIALALAGEPDLLLADEPTTALDVTVQAQVLSLLDDLRRRRGLAVLLVTHDLGIVAGRADRVAVMYAGKVVEELPAPLLAREAIHPYTRGLLRSRPRLAGTRERLQPIPGTVPVPGLWPTGCRFHPRCNERIDRCDRSQPARVELAAGHACACWVRAPSGDAR